MIRAFLAPFFHYNSPMISKARINLQFDVEEPIELVELTLALGSFGNQYQRFFEWKVRDMGISKEDVEESIKLYVTKLESNCVITELAAYSATSFPAVWTVLQHASTFKEFAEYFDAAVAYLKGAGIPANWKFWSFKKSDLIDWTNILETVAKNKPGRLKMSVKEHVTDEETKKHVELDYESKDVMEAKQGAIKRIEEAEAQDAVDYKAVLMHMPQMHETKTKKEGKTSSDMGIIERIYPKELPVFWLSDMDAQKVKSQTESPFKLNYVVDVNVQTVNGKPRSYRVVKLVEILQEPEE